MTRFLSALALVLTLCATQVNAAPKHRNHQSITAVTTSDSADSMGIEAYSDTSSVAEESQDSIIEESIADTHYSRDDDFDKALEVLGTTIGLGVGGIAIFVAIFLMFLALMPLIIVILLLRYLIKRHNARVELAEKAMATGQPIPDAMMPVDKQTDEYLWKRGIRNVALGFGLVVMFTIWDFSFLTGIGALVICYGAGQIVIGYTSAKRNQRNNDQQPEL